MHRRGHKNASQQSVDTIEIAPEVDPLAIGQDAQALADQMTEQQQQEYIQSMVTKHAAGQHGTAADSEPVGNENLAVAQVHSQPPATSTRAPTPAAAPHVSTVSAASIVTPTFLDSTAWARNRPANVAHQVPAININAHSLAPPASSATLLPPPLTLPLAPPPFSAIQVTAGLPSTLVVSQPFPHQCTQRSLPENLSPALRESFQRFDLVQRRRALTPGPYGIAPASTAFTFGHLGICPPPPPTGVGLPPSSLPVVPPPPPVVSSLTSLPPPHPPTTTAYYPPAAGLQPPSPSGVPPPPGFWQPAATTSGDGPPAQPRVETLYYAGGQRIDDPRSYLDKRLPPPQLPLETANHRGQVSGGIFRPNRNGDESRWHQDVRRREPSDRPAAPSQSRERWAPPSFSPQYTPFSGPDLSQPPLAWLMQQDPARMHPGWAQILTQPHPWTAAAPPPQQGQPRYGPTMAPTPAPSAQLPTVSAPAAPVSVSSGAITSAPLPPHTGGGIPPVYVLRTPAAPQLWRAGMIIRCNLQRPARSFLQRINPQTLLGLHL